jgi:hypothetical protein
LLAATALNFRKLQPPSTSNCTQHPQNLSKVSANRLRSLYKPLLVLEFSLTPTSRLFTHCYHITTMDPIPTLCPITGLTAEAKASVLSNLRLEIDARVEKLRAQCDAQCASLQSRLERRVNRIPVVTRQTTLLELLKTDAEYMGEPAPAPPTTRVKTAAVTKKAAAPAPATRKTRNAAPTNAIATSSAAPASASEERPRSAPKPNKPTPAYAKATKTTQAKKRSSDDMSSEDKENAELPAPKKRTKAAPAAQKPAAPTTRATRATSRSTKTAPAHVLSPKNNAANARKPAAPRTTRPR